MEPMTHTATTTTTERLVPARSAAINGLAVVGFVALVFIGITLAIYAARYIPETVSRLGAANVYFSSIFGDGEEETDLEVVPGDSIPFENDNDQEPAVPTNTPATPTTPTTPKPRPTTPVVITVPVTGTTAPLYGKADLSVRLMETGYLKTADTDSFVKDNTVPDGKRPAIKFRVTNNGTNSTGSWEFKAKLPTTSTFTYTSRTQRSLMPGEYVDYTLGFDRAKDGENHITITIDSGNDVSESNENNNTLSVEIDVEN